MCPISAAKIGCFENSRQSVESQVIGWKYTPLRQISWCGLTIFKQLGILARWQPTPPFRVGEFECGWLQSGAWLLTLKTVRSSIRRLAREHEVRPRTRRRAITSPLTYLPIHRRRPVMARRVSWFFLSRKLIRCFSDKISSRS